MAEFLINAALLVLILGSSWWLTAVFTRRMYYKCPSCGSLNARRRTHCRICRTPVGPDG